MLSIKSLHQQRVMILMPSFSARPVGAAPAPHVCLETSFVIMLKDLDGSIFSDAFESASL